MNNPGVNVLLGDNPIVRCCAQHHAQPVLARPRDGERAELGVAAHRGVGAAAHARGQVAA